MSNTVEASIEGTFRVQYKPVWRFFGRSFLLDDIFCSFRGFLWGFYNTWQFIFLSLLFSFGTPSVAPGVVVRIGLSLQVPFEDFSIVC